jgi:synaptobrevin homolog YKT6
VPRVTMKLYSISVLYSDGKSTNELCNARDLSSWNIFQRGSVGEFLTFITKTVAERTKAGQRQDVEQDSIYPLNTKTDSV